MSHLSLENFYISDDTFRLMICIDFASFLFYALTLIISEINSEFTLLGTNYTNFRIQIANSKKLEFIIIKKKLIAINQQQQNIKKNIRL